MIVGIETEKPTFAVMGVVLAAKAAKRLGIRDLILQIMLNDPKCIWGVNDLLDEIVQATLKRYSLC